MADKPFIPAEQTLPEITFKAVILSIVLTVILASANAYLGLKVGVTVSASIPAAIISMGVLRFFKQHNILENNIVQTAASSGEALTAGIMFTLPALIVIHYWLKFEYLPTVLIALVGGSLGVLFTVPLRRVLLADKELHFPEGTAIGNILKASALEGFGFKNLVLGGTFGALISLCQTGFQFFATDMQWWTKAGKTLIGAGLGFNPALIGAGYIIGIRSCLAIIYGIVIGWIIGVPVISYFYGIPQLDSLSAVAMHYWDEQIRYIGLGVMIVGGVWAFVTLIKPMFHGIKASLISVRHAREHGAEAIARTEREIPITVAFWGSLLLLLPVFAGLYFMSSRPELGLSTANIWGASIATLIYIIIGGFVLSSICAYFAGLVGSSANPLSSLALIALMLAALLLMGLMCQHTATKAATVAIAGMAIIVTAVIAGAASIGNDTLQDLKAGQLVGATPWKQQIMLIVGVLISALVIPLVLQLLFDAYGMAGVFPRPDMDPSHMLVAPQASLVAAVIKGIFTGGANWLMMGVGIIVALVTLVVDRILMATKGYHLSLLPVGLGIYLPVDTSSALVLGGVLSYLVTRALKHKASSLPEAKAKTFLHSGQQKGLLIASGLVAGAALMGVFLAVPFVITGSTNALKLMPDAAPAFVATLLSIMVTLGLFIWVIRTAATAEEV